MENQTKQEDSLVLYSQKQLVPLTDPKQQDMMNKIQIKSEGYSNENADDALALKHILSFSQKQIDIVMSRFNIKNDQNKTQEIKDKFTEIKGIANKTEQEWAIIYTTIQNDQDNLNKIIQQYDNFVNSEGTSDKVNWNVHMTKVQRVKLQESYLKKDSYEQKLDELIQTLAGIIQSIDIGSLQTTDKAETLEVQKKDQTDQVKFNQKQILSQETELNEEQGKAMLEQIELQKFQMDQADLYSDLQYSIDKLNKNQEKYDKVDQRLIKLTIKFEQKQDADQEKQLKSQESIDELDKIMDEEIADLKVTKNTLNGQYSRFMIANNEQIKKVRPSHFIFMFDVSHSMTFKDSYWPCGSSAWDNSKNYFNEFMKTATHLGENNIMSIFKFNCDFEKIRSKEKVSVLAQQKDILGECTGGGTNFQPVLEAAMATASEEGEHNTVFILMTDGQCNDQDKSLEQVKQLKFMNPSSQSILFVMGVGKAVRPEQLKRLAYTANKSDELQTENQTIKFFQHATNDKKTNWGEIFIQMTTAPRAHINQLKIDIETIEERIKLQTQQKQEQFSVVGDNWESKMKSLENMKKHFQTTQIEPLKKSCKKIQIQIEDERISVREQQTEYNNAVNKVYESKTKLEQYTQKIDQMKTNMNNVKRTLDGLNNSIAQIQKDIIETYETERINWDKGNEENSKKEAYLVKFACSNMNSAIMESRAFYNVTMNRIDGILKSEQNLCYLVDNITMDQLKMEFLLQFSSSDCRYQQSKLDLVGEIDLQLEMDKLEKDKTGLDTSVSSISQVDNSFLDELHDVTDWGDIKYLNLFVNRYWLVQMLRKQLGATKEMEKMLNDLLIATTFDMIFQNLAQGPEAEEKVEKKVKDCVKKRYAYRIILLKSKIDQLKRDKQEHMTIIEETSVLLEKEELNHEKAEDTIIKYKKVAKSGAGQAMITKARKQIENLEKKLLGLNAKQQKAEAKIKKLELKKQKVMEKGDADDITAAETDVQDAIIELNTLIDDQSEQRNDFDTKIVDEYEIIDDLDKDDAVAKQEKKELISKNLIAKYITRIQENESNLKKCKDTLKTFSDDYEEKANQIESDVDHVTVIFAQLRGMGNSNLERAKNKFYKQFINDISSNAKEINGVLKGFVQKPMIKEAEQRIAIKHGMGSLMLENK